MSYFFDEIDMVESPKSILNSHNKLSFPSYEQFLPFTELTVSLANDAIERDLGRIDMFQACDFILKRELSPESMLTALMYINRYKRTKATSAPNKRLPSFTSADLFLISMMLASKYLFDDGTEENVVNEEWAEDFGIENKEINELEIDFLNTLDWRLHVKSGDYLLIKQKISSYLAGKTWDSHELSGATYRELLLVHNGNVGTTVGGLIDLIFKATLGCVVIYAGIIIGVHMLVFTIHACQHSSYQQRIMLSNSQDSSFFNELSFNATEQHFDLYSEVNKSHSYQSARSYFVIRSRFYASEIN